MKYKEYILSDEWQQKKIERLRFDKWICCFCGKNATLVHHLTYRNIGHEPLEDLRSLCHRCHVIQHLGRKEAEEIYPEPVQTELEIETDSNKVYFYRASPIERLGHYLGVFQTSVPIINPLREGKEPNWKGNFTAWQEVEDIWGTIPEAM